MARTRKHKKVKVAAPKAQFNTGTRKHHTREADVREGRSRKPKHKKRWKQSWND